MRTYSVSLWADIIVEAKNEKAAIKEAYHQLNAGDDDNVVMGFLSSLAVDEDGVREVTDKWRLPSQNGKQNRCGNELLNDITD